MRLIPDLSTAGPDNEPTTLALADDDTSLDLLRAVYRNPAAPLSVRLRAAIAALPHEHPKLAVTANLNGETFADALERAIVRSGKAEVVNNARMIERQSGEES
jgi:hypothetical protein